MKSVTKTEQTIILILFALTILSLERVIFYFLNIQHFSTLSLEITLLGFFKGLRIDIITLFTFSAPFIIALFYMHRWRKFISYLWLIVVIGIFSVNLGDIIYFPFVHRHLSNEVFLLSNDLDFFVGIVGNYLIELILYLIIISILYYIWKKIVDLEISSKNYPTIQKIAFTFIIILILFLGIRGKITGKPFGLSDAFVNDNIASANLSINGLYSIYRGRSSKSYKFMEHQLAVNKTREILGTGNIEFLSDKFLIERKLTNIGEKSNYNIVILLVESFTSKYTDSFGDENFGVTPYFDKLTKESLSFPNFYANGQRSIEGITVTLTGIPSITGMPNLGYGLELSNFSYIGKVLKENGYSTVGMRSAKRGSFRIDSIFNLAGFDQFYGAEDIKKILKDERDISLPFGSIWDGNMLRFMKEKIDSSKKPFLTFGFTASTHFPCKLPNKKYEIYPHQEFGINGFLNNTRYFDSQLEEFIESSKKESWFKDTVFIITGDHTIGKGIGVKKDNLAHFKMPFIIYAPYIFEPQIIEHIGTQADIFPTIIDILNLENSFSTLSTSLLDRDSKRFGILREGNRMLFLDANRTAKDLESSENLKAILQTISNLVTKNSIFPLEK